MADTGVRTRTGRGAGGPRGRKPRETLGTWTFDSAGDRKYAVQIHKASNGNPCLRIIEGVPQEDGTFRKFHLTIWSEDFGRFFETLGQVRQFIRDKDVRTPPNHTWKPGGWKGGGGGGRGRGGGGGRG